MKNSAAVWWWSEPSTEWLPKILDHIKIYNGIDEDQPFGKK